ncbi:MAG: hypothetical protein V4481_00295 [Patescibacteria group bacterium]
MVTLASYNGEPFLANEGEGNKKGDRSGLRVAPTTNSLFDFNSDTAREEDAGVSNLQLLFDYASQPARINVVRRFK